MISISVTFVYKIFYFPFSLSLSHYLKKKKKTNIYVYKNISNRSNIVSRPRHGSYRSLGKISIYLIYPKREHKITKGVSFSVNAIITANLELSSLEAVKSKKGKMRTIVA